MERCHEDLSEDRTTAFCTGALTSRLLCSRHITRRATFERDTMRRPYRDQEWRASYSRAKPEPTGGAQSRGLRSFNTIRSALSGRSACGPASGRSLVSGGMSAGASRVISTTKFVVLRQLVSDGMPRRFRPDENMCAGANGGCVVERSQRDVHKLSIANY